MPSTDRYGLAISTSSESAAAHYRDGIDLMLAAWPGAERALEAALAIDPEFALAHAALARHHFARAEPAPAKAVIARAETLVSSTGTPREKSHVAIIALGIAGKPMAALDRTLAHLEEWPRDALIMGLPLGAFGLFAFSGRADHDQARVDLCERHKSHYADDWWFLGYHGWSHTENGNVRYGRSLTERSMTLRRENAHSAHALAHAMFEDGSVADAEALIEDWLPTYDRRAILHGHINWHQALLALEQDDCPRALRIYTESIRPEVSAAVPLNLVTDCVSLLWRLELAGYPVPPELWRDATATGNRAFPTAGQAFADVHMALAAAAIGDRAALDRRTVELENRLAAGRLPAGPVVPGLCRAIAAFRDGATARTVEILEPLAGDVVRIGGSHAQREVIEDTLLVPYLRTDETPKARALLDRRLHRRPSARDSRWRASLPV